MKHVLTREEIAAYRAEHECGIYEAWKALRVKYIREEIQAIKGNPEIRGALLDLLKLIVDKG